MRSNEIAKDRSSTAIEKGPLHLLLEIERRFRAEERKNLRSEWEIMPKLTKKPSADN